MKKIVLIIIPILFFITGCGTYSEKDIVNDLDKKVSNNKAYYLEGVLEIVNDENIYNYNVEVSYKKDDNYKVSLVNTSNNHEQIILKNNEGVYVVTPALNKSFKFQSDWPYSNSQIYLLQSILNDIKNDDKRKFSKEDNKYIFKTEVNYPNNRKLVSQEVTLDKKLKPKNIKVYDDNNISLMTMKFTKIDYSPTFKKDYFSLDNCIKSSKVIEDSKSVSLLEDSIYPLSLPSGTKLVSEEKVKKDTGERVIMTFDGEKPFLLVEETASRNDEMTIIPTNGEPYMLQDSYGVLANNSINFTSGGVEYYLVSDVLNQDELVDVAQSINVIPTMGK